MTIKKKAVVKKAAPEVASYWYVPASDLKTKTACLANFRKYDADYYDEEDTFLMQAVAVLKKKDPKKSKLNLPTIEV